MKRWGAIAIGALLILWVPFLYWQMRREPPAPVEPPPAAEAPAPELSDPPHDPALDAPAAATPPPAPAPAAPPNAPPAEPAPAPAAPAVPMPEVTTNPDGTVNTQNLPAPNGGPFTELKAKYENSPRDARAPETEQFLRDQFGKDEVPADMLRSVSCHEEACKMELYWSPDRVLAFMRLSMFWARAYSMDMAVSAGERNADGFTPLEMYLSRKPGEHGTLEK